MNSKTPKLSLWLLSRNKKQKCNQDFLWFSLLYKKRQEHSKIFNQTLHYSNEFNNFIVCHHKLSLHVIMTLFLFKTPTMFCKCVILPFNHTLVLHLARGAQRRTEGNVWSIFLENLYSFYRSIYVCHHVYKSLPLSIINFVPLCGKSVSKNVCFICVVWSLFVLTYGRLYVCVCERMWLGGDSYSTICASCLLNQHLYIFWVRRTRGRQTRLCCDTMTTPWLHPVHLRFDFCLELHHWLNGALKASSFAMYQNKI